MSLSSLQLDSSGEFDLLYNFFYVRDYRNVETYETFALPFTPLNFVPNLDTGIEDFISNKRLVWNFGDGTVVEAVTASHAYTEPGYYKVTCYSYDKNGTGYFDTYSANVEIKDFVEDRLEIGILPYPYNVLSADTGQIENPVTVNRFNSYRTLESGMPTITPYASGAAADYDYFKNGYDKLTYGHLYPYSSFVQQLTSSGIVENVEVDSVITENTPIYIKLSGSEIVYTTATDADAFYAGLSGTADVYFKSDYAGDCNLIFGYDQSDIFEYVNTTNYGISATILDNNLSYNNLSFSSNGLDGEGPDSTLSTFNIAATKFADTKISFVAKVKDDNNFTQKVLAPLSAGYDPTVNFSLLSGVDAPITVDATFNTNFQSLSTLTQGGFFKGYFTTNNSTLLEDVYLSGAATLSLGGQVVSGTSNTFTIYPSSFYTVVKEGENIDIEAAFKDIAEQPLFTDTPILMSDFIGSIFGNISSAQDSIGKATYEKIQNFFDNNTSIDESNVDELDGILQMLDLPELNKYSFPPKINRLIDLLSISKSQLFGRRNRNQTYYQSYGYKNNEFYGYNLGDKLDINSPITYGQQIVASEVYSGKFTTLNASFTGTRTLNDYDSSWGWPLLTGGGRDLLDIYNFYYQLDVKTDIENNIIAFDDPNNTISYSLTSYSDWSKNDGTVSNIFSQSLYDGLKLFED